MKKINIHFFSVAILGLLFSVFRGTAQENQVFQNVLGKLTTYVNINAPDKVYLCTDKDYYTNGETIWFKTYILNGITLLPSKKSKVVYVDLLNANDSLIAHRKLYADVSGAPGDITIGDKIEDGNYLLRAYTQYMLNGESPVFFQKEIPIWVQEIDAKNLSEDASNEQSIKTESLKNAVAASKIGKPLLRLFPEGGDLVTGLESSLGLKVTDAEGNGIALEGKIVDQNGNTVTPFRSYDFGLGVTRFTPMPNTTYYASIPIAGNVEKYQVPKALPKGYVLQVRNQGAQVLVQVSTNIDGGLEGTMLLGHLRGDVFFKQIEKESGKDTYAVKLLTAQLEDGVAQFTLFAPSGQPICERLIFIDNPENDVQLSITSDKTAYRYREQAKVVLGLTDKQGNLVNGDFSMSVVTENSLDAKTPDIKSSLLLDSDLGGTVEDPGYFFEEEGSNARKYLLDALMLTHGWRRFVWKDMLMQKVTPESVFPPEKGIMITGRTTAFENRYQPKKTMATLSILGNEIYQEKKLTNAQGRFNFGPLVFQDSVEAIINAVDIDQNSKNKSEYSIYVDPPFPKVNRTDTIRRKLNTKTITAAQQYLQASYRKKISDFKYGPKITQLKEVVVKAKKKTRQELIDEEISEMTLYGSAQNRLFPDSIPGTEAAGVFDLLRRVPGVQVLGTFPNQRVLIRGVTSLTLSSDPLFLIDGISVDASFLQNMQAREVLFVDVLKGAEAAIYGSRAANGVVAVYSQRALSYAARQERYPGVTNFEVPGFYTSREFYSPDYNTAKPGHDKPDYRTTLHWEPHIDINGKERSTTSFYTGDSSGKYTVKVEGITNDGRPVRGLYSFEVDAD